MLACHSRKRVESAYHKDRDIRRNGRKIIPIGNTYEKFLCVCFDSLKSAPTNVTSIGLFVLESVFDE